MSWRGRTLIIEKSHLYANGAVLRDPVSLVTVNTPATKKRAIEWCKRNGYSWMQPGKNVSVSDLEKRF